MTTDVDIVVKLDLGYTPEAAVSGAVLIQTEYSTFLTFNAKKLAEDGFYHDAGTALVEFNRCLITKFGYPNDEALGGHPLAAKMQGAYDIYEVLNSSWAMQLEQQNKVLFPNTGKWKSRHFIFTFHDSTFECLADNLKLEILNEPYETIFERIAKHVVSE
jgi:hypothetical protein